MSKFLAIPDFAKAGLNTDLLPWDLPGSFLTNIRNIRIANNMLEPFGGSRNWATLPVDFIPGHIVHVGGFWVVPGREAVYVYDNATFTDISSGAYVGVDEDLWNSCKLAEILVINNPTSYPEYWPQQSTSTAMEILPWDAVSTWEDQSERCKVMRSHKQFLFALNLVSDGDSITDGVRWSSPADVGGLPQTWDPFDTTNVAGIVNLGGDGGAIVDGLSLRDAFVVYRENGITVFDYVGGTFIWQIRHLDGTSGLISSDAIVQVRGLHYFIGDGDILVNDGNTITSLLHNKIRTRFVATYNSETFHRSYALRNSIASEVWFCIPESGHDYPNIAYIYNWRDDTWAIRDIPEGPFANFGPQGSPPLTWDTYGNIWDKAVDPWEQSQLTPLDDTIVAVTKPSAVGQSGELLLLDRGQAGEQSAYDSVIERIGFALEGLDDVNTITRIYPHIAGPGKIYIQVGSQSHPSSPVLWKDKVLFDPVTDRSIDIRTTGALHSFRVSNADDLTWTISGIDIEYAPAGKR